MKHNTLLSAAVMFGVISLQQCSLAGDWPQILGPNRDGRAVDEPQLKPWPAAGPSSVWTHDVGSGYAGPAVADDRVIIFHRVGDQERVEALDANRGDVLWQTDFDTTYRGGVDADKGPRCVPLVSDGRVFVFGAAGNLHCVDLEDGKEIWSRDIYAEYDGDEGYFGAGSSPLVVGDKLFLNVGGRSAGLVAFDVKDGATAWEQTDEAASYSSPRMATIDGEDHVIFVTRLNLVSVDPKDGSERFRFPFGKRGPTVNAATPLVFGNNLFVSSSYGIGCQLSRIDPTGATTVWKSDVMASQYTTCVFHRGYLYGTHGREDRYNGELRCIDAATGQQIWGVEGFGVANVILVGDQLLALNSEGKLSLSTASPDGYTPLAEAVVSQRTTRALPALSNGRLYFRDNSGRNGTLHCLQLGETP